jgi:hypothetical protein
MVAKGQLRLALPVGTAVFLVLLCLVLPIQAADYYLSLTNDEIGKTVNSVGVGTCRLGVRGLNGRGSGVGVALAADAFCG